MVASREVHAIRNFLAVLCLLLFQVAPREGCVSRNPIVVLPDLVVTGRTPQRACE